MERDRGGVSDDWSGAGGRAVPELAGAEARKAGIEAEASVEILARGRMSVRRRSRGRPR